MSKHTPGPWIHHPEDNIITTKGDCKLIECQARSLHVSTSERDANARLIAAAPELLEVLVDVMFRHVPFSNKAEYAEKARAAIAKATGEQLWH